jgi:putative transposase
MNKHKQLFWRDNTDTQIQEIKAAIKQNKDKRMHIKYLVIINHLHGLQNIQIAINTGLCAHTVGTYIRKYKEGGLNNLMPVPNPGAPRRLSEEQEKQLVQVITTHTPDEVGFPFRKNWNSILIKDWVKNNFGIEYCQSGMLYVLYRLNLSFTRPTYTLAKADLLKQEEFKQNFELLKKPS